MGINFPDLQVLLPRTEEIARTASAGQQQDVHQQSLAQAALVRAERDRSRITRTRQSDRAGRPRKERSDGQRRHAPSHPTGKGDRLDVQA